MLKQLILLFNIVSYIIITALLPADIKIDTKLPTDASFVIDSTHIIEVTITKGSIFGFAKFQQNVPDGFVAHPVETADASFTFADGKVKFIWMAIPEQNDVKISYALIASDGAAPEGVIAGKFSYLEDNERKSYDIPNIPIKVISDEPVVEIVPAIANANRTVTDLGNNEYEVVISIAKEGVEGFGKIEEYLPEGAEAEVVDNNKAVFSQVDEKAKFVWMAVPDGESVSVSYKVKSQEDIAQTLSAMQGNFSYLDNNETKTVAVMGGAPVEAAAVASLEETSTENEEVLAEEPIEKVQEVVEEEVADVFIAKPMPKTEEEKAVKEEIQVASTVKAEVKPEVIKEVIKEEVAEDVAQVEEQIIKEPVKKPVVVEPKPIAKQPNDKPKEELVASNTKKPVSIPDPNNGVSYKVQIAAGKKVVSEKYIRKAYSFQEPFGIENHEGWVKYTTGSYDIYKGARDKREALVAARHNFPGPFVTAYNGDERITVQEALMISNQKWYK